jgi:hypothetical protein
LLSLLGARSGFLNHKSSAADLIYDKTGLADPDPIARIGPLDMLENVPVNRLWPFVAPLLDHPVRDVRIRTASLLAPVPTASQPKSDREREAFNTAAMEFVASQRANAERPEARTMLANYTVYS